jgi:hypothetical protein
MAKQTIDKQINFRVMILSKFKVQYNIKIYKGTQVNGFRSISIMPSSHGALNLVWINMNTILSTCSIHSISDIGTAFGKNNNPG